MICARVSPTLLVLTKPAKVLSVVVVPSSVMLSVWLLPAVVVFRSSVGLVVSRVLVPKSKVPDAAGLPCVSMIELPSKTNVRVVDSSKSLSNSARFASVMVKVTVAPSLETAVMAPSSSTDALFASRIANPLAATIAEISRSSPALVIVMVGDAEGFRSIVAAEIVGTTVSTVALVVSAVVVALPWLSVAVTDTLRLVASTPSLPVMV